MAKSIERQCTECGAAFTGRYRKCPPCRPYRTDRLCAGCGKAFHGETLNCSACQRADRRCVTCGKAFRSRYLECRQCRAAKIVPQVCQAPGCGNLKVQGQGSKLCQEHRDSAYQRKLERLRKTDCRYLGCAEPKLAGKFRYCAKHSAESGQREKVKIVRRRREREYGLTHDGYVALFEAQGGVCAICGNGQQRRGLAVDHDHETGQIRGLLCDRCNPMLGYARDNAAVLQAAIAYLERADQVLSPSGV